MAVYQAPLSRPSDEELIRRSFKDQDVKVWGFVLVRCTYTSPKNWIAFLAELEHKYWPTEERQHYRWTTIEDEPNLNNATMYEASKRFEEWVKTKGAQEMGKVCKHAPPRHYFYFYVNEESIQSIINPVRAAEVTGNFLIMVFLTSNLLNEFDDDPNELATVHSLSVDPDESFRMISPWGIANYYADYEEDVNVWYEYGIHSGPPFVGGGRISEEKIRILEQKYEVGLDVYMMLKRIYGELEVVSLERSCHLRSRTGM